MTRKATTEPQQTQSEMTMQLVKTIYIGIPHGLLKPEKIHAHLKKVDPELVITPWEHSEVAIHGQVTLTAGKGENKRQYIIRGDKHAYKVYKL